MSVGQCCSGQQTHCRRRLVTCPSQAHQGIGAKCGGLALGPYPCVRPRIQKQSTCETATYGSEFSVGRTGMDQVQDLRTLLRYLGVPVKDKSRVFGDNESVVRSSTVPHSRLLCRHSALAYHRVRECIASGMASFHHLPGALNPADILSKHWGYQAVWPTLQPILFWEGDTEDLL